MKRKPREADELRRRFQAFMSRPRKNSIALPIKTGRRAKEKVTLV